ncbi:DUF1054 domain-containing protein [Shouchella lonarensis]|uniref:UPF0637 protein SAMN05421737_107126 n=1 Tax=Shouchella lonarensis TaxID=1464122 RepID=A0A1G6KT92_9BACI|nr:DUF1054 domain-containing protein [Shouchella lonarensis]SDC33596.1 Uncharacterized protein YktB, UPF0637 family [Shouchella lonarensis]
MTLPTFTAHDFAAFHVDGLAERMEAIQTRIQPKFAEIGATLAQELSLMLGQEMFLHIAKHARRKTNPPNDTWLAVAENKRGYKKHPHFQVGLFDDHVFIWLAYIYECPDKQAIANTFLAHEQTLKETIPDHYVVSLDHMKKEATPFSTLDLRASLQRFHSIKKAEWLVGRHIPAESPILKDGHKLMATIIETVQTLCPIYQLSRQL